MTTDRIEKQILLRPPLARVARAHRCRRVRHLVPRRLKGQFTPGETIKGSILHPGYEHMTMELLVERMEPERLFSYRWHPYAIDPAVDYSSEPTTLVEFQLEEVADGTLLTIVESGFDRIPVARRDEAFRMNEHGWARRRRTSSDMSRRSSAAAAPSLEGAAPSSPRSRRDSPAHRRAPLHCRPISIAALTTAPASPGRRSPSTCACCRAAWCAAPAKGGRAAGSCSRRSSRSAAEPASISRQWDQRWTA